MNVKLISSNHYDFNILILNTYLHPIFSISARKGGAVIIVFKYHTSSYSFRPCIVSAAKIQFLSKRFKYWGNCLNWLQFPNSKKNSFWGNYMRKNGNKLDSNATTQNNFRQPFQNQLAYLIFLQHVETRLFMQLLSF